MSDKECPKCHENSMEIVVLDFDYQRGMARCKLCFHKMRLKDYYYWEEHGSLDGGEEI
jgi:transcription elongation factor Elf1